MAHSPKPFYRTARYAQVAGKQVKLAPGPKSALTEQAAWAAFHRLMAGGGPAAEKSAGSRPPGGLSAADVFEKYLAWCRSNRTPRTYEWTRANVQSLCDHLLASPATHPARLAASAVRPYHVTEWLAAKPTWGPTSGGGRCCR